MSFNIVAPIGARSGRRLAGRVAGAAIAAAVLGPGAAVSNATVVNSPPVDPHSIIAFPARDFVSASGYAAGVPVTVDVVRAGAVIASASVMPQDDPKTVNVFDGIVEVNHPGGGCWAPSTPDIGPGDVVRTTAAGVIDETPVANVTAQLAVKTAPDTVTVSGTAQDTLGLPLPLDQIQNRLIAKKSTFQKNNRRLLRSDKDGTLAYDAPGSIHWTATYSKLSASDVLLALGAQSRGTWLGRNPLAGTEQTIFEIGGGVVPGPQAPCTL